jgi:transcriptional regulator with XRE-family HTH domain
MSQAKISRIERGRTLPTVLDVERILKALDVPRGLASELITLARRANVEHTSWRAMAEIGLWRKQTELKKLAESCTVQRLFLPAMPSGLLQVPEYARAALSPLSRPVRRGMSTRPCGRALSGRPCSMTPHDGSSSC